MAAYESAQLVESLHDEGVEQVAVQRQRAVPWRRVGLAAAVVGTLGAAVGTSLLSKPPTPAQQMHKMRKSLLQAFSSRALTEAAELKTRFNFTFAEENSGEPSAMSIDATVETTEAEVDTMTVKVIFNAQEGKGDDLVQKFNDVVAGIKAYAEAMGGEGSGAAVDQVVTVAAGEEDEAVITLVPPPGPMESDPHEDDLAAALAQPPRFTASFKTGRSIVQMYDNIDENIAMLPKGVSGHVDAAFSSALLEAADASMDDSMPMALRQKRHEMAVGARILDVFSLFEMNYNFRYRAGDDVVKAFDELPNLKQAVEMIAMNFEHAPASILEPIGALAASADGVKSLEITGLPHKYGISVAFTNFHILPILKDIIADIKAQSELGARIRH